MAELYKLPDGWEWKKLGDNSVCKLIMGQSPSSDTYNSNGNGMAFFQGKKEFGEIYPTVEQYTTEPKKIAEIGDILLSVRAPVGPTNIANIKCCIGRGLGAIRPNKSNTLTNYLLYFFRNFELEISNKGKGSTFSAITKKELEETDIPLPPLKEQKRIVAKLDILFAKIDKAIALHQKNCEEADIFMASVLNDVFVELEEKYEKKQLNEIVIFGGKNISTLEYPNLIYFSLEDIETQTGKILNYKTVNESGVKGTAVSFDDNVVLYSKLRPYLNKVIVPNLEGCATTELVVLKPKDKLDKYFLASYLRSSNIVNFLNNDSMGAKMPRTNMKTFRNLDIPLPSLKAQQKVVSYLDEISNKIEKIKQIQKEKMQSLKELKASILDKAFKGEL
ncbi:restriction endonuclease subunit S [Aliarcobacter cryaerophilus]|uniref:restriction endonuclease subunit S n=1 Tax=Aliarcobacter cryaerophilus TaxID=28198 RepID=UPI0008315E83|nr:restriction endonuclease subunit S [Aliarcobacter cryaerophilus]